MFNFFRKKKNPDKEVAPTPSGENIERKIPTEDKIPETEGIDKPDSSREKKNSSPQKRKKGTRGQIEETPPDEILIPMDVIRDVLNQIGRQGDKFVESQQPKPLSVEEQEKVLNNVRMLFKAERFKEILDLCVPLADKQSLTGKIQAEVFYATGYAAIKTGDKKNIQRFRNSVVSYTFATLFSTMPEEVVQLNLYTMEMAEKHLPGCMRDVATRMYPHVKDRFGASHELTVSFKKYTL